MKLLSRPTYAPSIDKVILQREQLVREEGTATGTAINSLVMMNLDGSGEERIEIR